MAREIRTWVVVADGARARIYENLGPGQGLKEILQEQSETNPTRDIVSDRQGRHKDAQGTGHHAMDPRTDPHAHAEREFARQLCGTLEHGAGEGSFDRIVLAAAPRTLGHLREMMTQGVRERVHSEIDKDYTRLSLHDLSERLSDVVRL